MHAYRLSVIMSGPQCPYPVDFGCISMDHEFYCDRVSASIHALACLHEKLQQREYEYLSHEADFDVSWASCEIEGRRRSQD